MRHEFYQRVTSGHGQTHEGVCKIVPVNDEERAMPDARQPAQCQGGDGRRHLNEGCTLSKAARLCNVCTKHCIFLKFEDAPASKSSLYTRRQVHASGKCQIRHYYCMSQKAGCTCKRMTSGDGIQNSSIASSQRACNSAFATSPRLLGR